MIKTNTTLNIKYNTETKELMMTSEIFRVWLNTYPNLSTEQKNEFLKTLCLITKEE